MEETHYYPYGLTMAGISDKAIKTQYAENKYRFDGGTELQNKEFSDGSGLELYETTFRSFDPQLGRFFQIDPLADKFHSMTTYQYAGDNPVLSNDPTGSSFQPNVSHGQGTDNSLAETQAIAAAMDQDDANWGEYSYGGGSGGGGGGGGSDGGDEDNSCPLVGPSDSDNGGSNSTDGSGNTLDGVNPDDMEDPADAENGPDSGIPGWIYSNVNGIDVAVTHGAAYGAFKPGSSQYESGEQMDISADVSCLPYTSYQWIQTTLLNDETDLNGQSVWSLDGPKENNTYLNPPFYYMTDDPNQTNSAWLNTPASSFNDNPGTPLWLSGSTGAAGGQNLLNISWAAQATLVGISPQGQLTPLVSVNWGYTANYGTVWSWPISFSATPNAATQDQINQYNQKQSPQ
jgi:RHS repeat-associated protein